MRTPAVFYLLWQLLGTLQGRFPHRICFVLENSYFSIKIHHLQEVGKWVDVGQRVQSGSYVG